MTLGARLAKLEAKYSPQAMPWLSISRSGRDNERDAIGFEGYPPRDVGELWSNYQARSQRWAATQPSAPLAFVRYREDND